MYKAKKIGNQYWVVFVDGNITVNIYRVGSAAVAKADAAKLNTKGR